MVRPDRPLNGSYQKVSTVALFLLDCIGLLPILGNVIGEAPAYDVLVPRNTANISNRYLPALLYLPGTVPFYASTIVRVFFFC